MRLLNRNTCILSKPFLSVSLRARLFLETLGNHIWWEIDRLIELACVVLPVFHSRMKTGDIFVQLIINMDLWIQAEVVVKV